VDADAPPRPPAAELALRVLVAARQPIARMGLRGLVADLPDVVVVGQAATVEDAAQLALDLLAHAVLATWDSGDADEVVALAEALSGS
jgi:DNA-binding NarL/FixJ family response regulator